MTKSLNDRKYWIIQKLIITDDEGLISDLESRLLQEQEEVLRPPIWDAVFRPMRRTISVKALVQEQGYRPINRAHFFNLTDELAIEGNIEKLLAQL